MKHKAFAITIVVITLLSIGLVISGVRSVDAPGQVRIGVITALTGDVAYWGQSALAGIALAKQELAAEGIDARVYVEDAQLDPVKALSAAQKLVSIDHVQAVYPEFNPASISVSSYLKDKDIIELYDATPVSPLSQNPDFYKTYLNYEQSCKEVSQLLKKRGIDRVGVLEMNIEFGLLCTKGIEEVYGPDAIVETYNPGATDLRTQLAKLNAAGVQAISNGSYQPETLVSIKNMSALGMKQVFVGLRETMTPDVIPRYSPTIQGAIFFGLPPVDPVLVARMQAASPSTKIVDQNAAGLAYAHVKQLGEALHACASDTACVRKWLDAAPADPRIGFKGFVDRAAQFDTKIEVLEGDSFQALTP